MSKKKVGEYILDQRIGRGSFAAVWKGHQVNTNESVAVKVISRHTVHETAQLKQEVNVLKFLEHKHIVKFKDFKKSQGHFYLILEFCAGGDLAKFIQKKGIVQECVAQNFLQQIASGLKVLHEENYIHRDLKPQNILLSSQNENAVLKIADFGFARNLQPHDMADTICGSPLYMAPEILRHERYDSRADLWSVGAIVYELLFGSTPFTGHNPLELLRNIESYELTFPAHISISEQCRNFLTSLLCRDPKKRMSSHEFFFHSYLGLSPIYYSLPLCPTSFSYSSSSPSSSKIIKSSSIGTPALSQTLNNLHSPSLKKTKLATAGGPCLFTLKTKINHLKEDEKLKKVSVKITAKEELDALKKKNSLIIKSDDEQKKKENKNIKEVLNHFKGRLSECTNEKDYFCKKNDSLMIRKEEFFELLTEEKNKAIEKENENKEGNWIWTTIEEKSESRKKCDSLMSFDSIFIKRDFIENENGMNNGEEKKEQDTLIEMVSGRDCMQDAFTKENFFKDNHTFVDKGHKIISRNSNKYENHNKYKNSNKLDAIKCIEWDEDESHDTTCYAKGVRGERVSLEDEEYVFVAEKTNGLYTFDNVGKSIFFGDRYLNNTKVKENENLASKFMLNSLSREGEIRSNVLSEIYNTPFCEEDNSLTNKIKYELEAKKIKDKKENERPSNNSRDDLLLELSKSNVLKIQNEQSKIMLPNYNCKMNLNEMEKYINYEQIIDDTDNSSHVSNDNFAVLKTNTNTNNSVFNKNCNLFKSNIGLIIDYIAKEKNKIALKIKVKSHKKNKNGIDLLNKTYVKKSNNIFFSECKNCACCHANFNADTIIISNDKTYSCKNINNNNNLKTNFNNRYCFHNINNFDSNSMHHKSKEKSFNLLIDNSDSKHSGLLKNSSCTTNHSTPAFVFSDSSSPSNINYLNNLLVLGIELSLAAYQLCVSAALAIKMQYFFLLSMQKLLKSKKINDGGNGNLIGNYRANTYDSIYSNNNFKNNNVNDNVFSHSKDTISASSTLLLSSAPIHNKSPENSNELPCCFKKNETFKTSSSTLVNSYLPSSISFSPYKFSFLFSLNFFFSSSNNLHILSNHTLKEANVLLRKALSLFHKAISITSNSSEYVEIKTIYEMCIQLCEWTERQLNLNAKNCDLDSTPFFLNFSKSIFRFPCQMFSLSHIACGFLPKIFNDYCDFSYCYLCSLMHKANDTSKQVFLMKEDEEINKIKNTKGNKNIMRRRKRERIKGKENRQESKKVKHKYEKKNKKMYKNKRTRDKKRLSSLFSSSLFLDFRVFTNMFDRINFNKKKLKKNDRKKVRNEAETKNYVLHYLENKIKRNIAYSTEFEAEGVLNSKKKAIEQSYIDLKKQKAKHRSNSFNENKCANSYEKDFAKKTGTYKRSSVTCNNKNGFSSKKDASQRYIYNHAVDQIRSAACCILFGKKEEAVQKLNLSNLMFQLLIKDVEEGDEEYEKLLHVIDLISQCTCQTMQL